MAVRGKLAQQIPQRKPKESVQDDTSASSSALTIVFSEIQIPLIDPSLQDLGPRNRFYISHCKTRPYRPEPFFDHSCLPTDNRTWPVNQSVCRDMVSSDRQIENNPFRSIVTLLTGFNYLREIILATSAVHVVALKRARSMSHHNELVDALSAKGRAYQLLRHALDHVDPTNKPIIMIAVIFFINFDLIDSGRGKWRTHVEAAGNLIASFQSLDTPLLSLPSSVSRLADVVVADCISYYILGSLFAPADDPAMSAFARIDIPATLQRAAAYSYNCCPPLVLDSLRKASSLSPEDVTQATLLLETLRAFNISSWVYNIPGLPPLDDLDIRVSMARAHRAAACLYIVLAVPLASCLTAEDLVYDILACLAPVPVDHPLAKGAIWPTFMAGAQADDWVKRQWCLGRMQAVFDSTPWVCPWGYIDSAMKEMQRIWEMRDLAKASGNDSCWNWLQEVRKDGDQCLIV